MQQNPGSPPRMRGKGPHVSKMAFRLRITPAYAGKSLSAPKWSGVEWDHPRVCGEKTKKIP